MKLLKQILKASIIPVAIIIIYFSFFLANSFLHTKVSNVATVGVTTLPEDKKDAELHANVGKELLKGQKVTGSFTASENNLGLVLLRFYNFERISKDKVIFRIKENGSKDWYYTNIYKVDQFQPNEYFTFGFSPIENSKGKQYDFEIESTAGKPKNAIGISTTFPQIGAAYQFTKTQLSQNKILAVRFFIKKSVFFIERFNWRDIVLFYLVTTILILFSTAEVNTRISEFVNKHMKKTNSLQKKIKTYVKKKLYYD